MVLRWGVGLLLLVLSGCAGLGEPGGGVMGAAGTAVGAGVIGAAGGDGPNIAAHSLLSSQNPALSSLATTAEPRSQRLLLVQTGANWQLADLRGHKWSLRSPQDLPLQSPVLQSHWRIQASLWVFVGYGLEVPALGWDPYHGRELHGKTAVVLAAAPALLAGQQVDSHLALTHPVPRQWDDWRIKVQTAQRHGAALVLLVGVPTQPEGAAPGPRGRAFNPLVLASPEHGLATVPSIPWAWVSPAQLESWVQRAGRSWPQLRDQAALPEFRAVPMPVQSTLELSTQWDYQEFEFSRAAFPGA